MPFIPKVEKGKPPHSKKNKKKFSGLRLEVF